MNIMPHYDIAIVGGGPAGSSAAIRLAHAGRSVLLLEQKRFPREKLCGEFISPECLAHFCELGVLGSVQAGAVAIGKTVFYARSGASVTVSSDWFAAGGQALGLSRAEMDTRLLERARAVGVTVAEDSRVKGVLLDQGRVHGVELHDGSHATAALTIDATGRSRALTREVASVRTRRAAYVAFKSHLTRCAIDRNTCEIYAYRGGYGGCSPVEDGLYNLCFVISSTIARRFQSDAAAIMRNVVCSNARARAALSGASMDTGWLAVPIESYGRSDLAPIEGLLAVGDAAAFIDPFTGSGILLALDSAKALAGAITAGWSERPLYREIADDYQRRHRDLFHRRLTVSSLVRRAAFAPLMAEALIRVLALSEGLTRRVAGATRNSAAPS